MIHVLTFSGQCISGFTLGGAMSKNMMGSRSPSQLPKPAHMVNGWATIIFMIAAGVAFVLGTLLLPALRGSSQQLSTRAGVGGHTLLQGDSVGSSTIRRFAMSNLMQPHSSSSNCSEEWLRNVASQSVTSYTHEEVLRAKLQQPACTLAKDADLGHVLFVVMCSKDLQQRAVDMAQGWLHWVPQENIILLCGDEIPGLNVTLLPKLAVDDDLYARFINGSQGYTGANLRDLRSMWWLVHEQPGVLLKYDWVFYVDDDTFVNVPLLMSFLQGIPSQLLLLISHMWSPRVWPPYEQDLTWPSGGGGMLFTRAAFQQLGSVLFSPLCEVVVPLNDVSVGRCAGLANVTKVDSTKFIPDVKYFQKTEGRLDAGKVVAVHYVKTREQLMEFTCLVATRFGWPHPQCSAATESM